DDLAFHVDEKDLAPIASRGQQRSLLLDDAFSELDPERRDHLVERLVSLPQTIITTTTLADLAPRLVAVSRAQEVIRGPRGSEVHHG
ncbi:MAG: hypothetical protein EBX15_07125, partial [Acidimicrobiia bacterium]|nr:hypothetical protein [Acidimicrobiia bacterium]